MTLEILPLKLAQLLMQLLPLQGPSLELLLLPQLNFLRLQATYPA